MPDKARVRTVDFWRGLVLVVIFINHVPGNLLENVTPRNYGLSDSAEAFVFISGLAVALAYAPLMARPGLRQILVRAWRRAALLYGVHLLLTFAGLALFANAFILSGKEIFIAEHGRNLVFAEPGPAIAGILLLGHQIGYFNILPLYIVLMLLAPFLLALMRISIPLALGCSLAIYSLVVFFGLNLPSWPVPGTWFFNPFAWQLVFTLGIAAGLLWRGQKTPYSEPLFVASVAIVAASLFVMRDGFGLAPGANVRLHAIAGAAADKTNLGWLRLVHFLALAYVIEHLDLGRALSRLPIASNVIAMGRHGLTIFAAGSLLSAVGQVTITAGQSVHLAGMQALGVLFVVAGIGALGLLARSLEWQSPALQQSGEAFQPAQASGPLRSSASC